ncbi:general substrate transporter [Thozetella sp. PMI_491]|nr:general substrate transporter [Thozetella sp. PMI_491]
MRFSLTPADHQGTPREIYGWRPYFLAITTAWASAAFGYDAAFIGGAMALPAFKHAFGLDTAPPSQAAALSSNIVSTFQAGAFFGSFVGFFLGERFGRKRVIMAAMAVLVIGVVLQLIQLLALLYVGRSMTGFGVGISAMLLPVYIAECSPPLIRGRLVGIFEIMLQIALVCGFWVNYGVAINVDPHSDSQWRIPISIQFVPALLTLICMPWNIESPRWLVTKNRIAEARKNLAWVRHLPEDHEYVEKELNEIQASVELELEMSGGKQTTWELVKEISRAGVRNRLIIGVTMMWFQNLTGINAINSYSPLLLQSIGYTGTTVSLLATGVYGILKMCSTVVFMIFIVDRFGRRPPLLVGALVIVIAMYYIGSYAKISGSFDHEVPRDNASNAALAMVYIFIIAHSASWTGIPWIFASESFPTRVRTLGVMIIVCSQWLAQFCVVYSLPYMLAAIKYGTFFFYGSCTVGAFLYAWLFVPETKGIPLEDMDLLFSDAPIYAPAARKRYLESKAAGLDAIAVHRLQQKSDVQQVEVA